MNLLRFHSNLLTVRTNIGNNGVRIVIFDKYMCAWAHGIQGPSP